MKGDPREMAKRLRDEALQHYTPRIPDSPFPEVNNTLGFFQYITAQRGMMDTMILPMKLVQDLATLAQTGFEIAADSEYEHEQTLLAHLLDQIWYHFTVTLIRWVKGRKETRIYNQEEAYYYGCFMLPEWFIEEARTSDVIGSYVDEEHRYIYNVNTAFLDDH